MSCPWTTPDECAMAAERAVAGTDQPAPVCVDHERPAIGDRVTVRLSDDDLAVAMTGRVEASERDLVIRHRDHTVTRWPWPLPPGWSVTIHR